MNESKSVRNDRLAAGNSKRSRDCPGRLREISGLPPGESTRMPRTNQARIAWLAHGAKIQIGGLRRHSRDIRTILDVWDPALGSATEALVSDATRFVPNSRIGAVLGAFPVKSETVRQAGKYSGGSNWLVGVTPGENRPSASSEAEKTLDCPGFRSPTVSIGSEVKGPSIVQKKKTPVCQTSICPKTRKCLCETDTGNKRREKNISWSRASSANQITPNPYLNVAILNITYLEKGLIQPAFPPRPSSRSI